MEFEKVWRKTININLKVTLKMHSIERFIVARNEFWVCWNILFVDDISYKKVTTQSKTYKDRQDYDPNNAVDRRYSTCTRAPEIGQSSPDKSMWWKVDLGRMYAIYSVTIMFKKYELDKGLYLKMNFFFYFFLK